MDWRRWLPNERSSLGRALLVGAGACAIGAFVRLPVRQAVGVDLPFVTFFPALLGAGIWGGMGAGLICLALDCAVSVAFILPRSDLPHTIWALLAFVVSGGLLVLAGSALASAIRELRETQRLMAAAQADLQTLVGELAHRSRNGLTVIMSIISQSVPKADTARELAAIVNARLGAMADAQDEVVRSGGDWASLSGLLERTLSPFDLGRFDFKPSPPLQVGRETATALALVTHELATNAVKHGALSSPNGKVELGWNAELDSVPLLWRERGGPPSSEPETAGFGTRLLKSALAQHGGRAERRFEADGVVCVIDFPHTAPA